MANRRPAGDGMVRQKKRGQWEGRITVGHKSDGKPIFRYVYGKTQKETLEKLHQRIEDYRGVELTEDSKMTLGEWLDRWMNEYMIFTIRESTWDSYAEASDQLIDEVYDEIDITGYAHALRDNDIRHIRNSHGEGTNEKYPVTKEDLAKIPNIVTNYDKVFVKTNAQGKPGLVYVKVGENNVTYYVEAITEEYHKEKLLVNKQMIKTGGNEIPNLYGLVVAINKKESSAQYLADLQKIREAYVQDVKENYSNSKITQSDADVKLSLRDTERKAKQLDIILENNPAYNTYSTWIRDISDIKTFEETLQDNDWADWEESDFDPDYTSDMVKEALDSGKITVYSSYPIEQGVFVTPSKMEAQSYSANGRVYSKIVDLKDVAWIDPTQGQYTKVLSDDVKASLSEDLAPVAPAGTYNVYGKDIAREDDFAPLPEGYEAQQTSESRLKPAPVVDWDEITDEVDRQEDVDTKAIGKPLSEYAAEKRTVLQSYLNAVDDSIKSLVQRVKAGDLTFKRQKISDVSERTVADIEESLGIDVSGYTHNINTNGVQHIVIRHGESGKHDTSMAIDDDIVRVGWVLENYDRVELLTDNGEQVYSSEFVDGDNNPAPQVRFVKKIDGTYYIVEAAFENSYKKLWVQSAYLQKNEDVTQAPAEGNSTNHETNARSALTSPSSKKTIADDNQNVKYNDYAPVRGTLREVGVSSDDFDLPIKTVKERLEAKQQNLQNELANIQNHREQASENYSNKIAALKAEYDSKKNKDTKVANGILGRIERLQRLAADVEADYKKHISDMESKIGKNNIELQKDHTKADHLERTIARIDNRLAREKADLEKAFEQRKAKMQSELADKNVYVSAKAFELYQEIRNLKKGVRASDQLGYLLDYGYSWGSIKTALLNVKAKPDTVVNTNSEAESAVREMLGREYEDSMYELEDLDNEYQREVEELEADAEKQRETARSEAQAIRRKELHSGIIDNVKTTFIENGFNFDEVLKNAKNLSTFSTVDNTPQRVMEKAHGFLAYTTTKYTST